MTWFEQVLSRCLLAAIRSVTGVPGLAKTLLVRTVASVLDLSVQTQFSSHLT